MLVKKQYPGFPGPPIGFPARGTSVQREAREAFSALPISQPKLSPIPSVPVKKGKLGGKSLAVKMVPVPEPKIKAKSKAKPKTKAKLKSKAIDKPKTKKELRLAADELLRKAGEEGLTSAQLTRKNAIRKAKGLPPTTNEELITNLADLLVPDMIAYVLTNGRSGLGNVGGADLRYYPSPLLDLE